MLVVLMTLTALAAPKKKPVELVPFARIGENISVDGTWEPTPAAAPSPPWPDQLLVDQTRSAVLLQWNSADKKVDPDVLVLPFSWISHFAVRAGDDDVAAEMAMVGKDGRSFLVARRGDVSNARQMLPSLAKRKVVDLPVTAPWPTYTPSSSRTPPQLGLGSVVVTKRTRSVPIPSTVKVGDRAAVPPPYADDPMAAALVGQTRGTVDAAALAEALAKGEDNLTACYVTARASEPDLQGEVTVRFILGSDGRIVTAKPSGGVGGSALQSCLVAGVTALELPAPDGGVAVVDCPVEMGLR